MISTQAVIIAAGDGSRWGDHLGVPKHLAPILDVPILYRTVAQLLARGVEPVYVVGPDDERYDVDGSKLYVPTLTPEFGDADKFLSSRELWSRSQRNLIVYGDVWWSEWGMDRLCGRPKYDPVNDALPIEEQAGWWLFARPYGSYTTGNGDGECFAQSIMPNELARHERALWRIVDEYQARRLGRNGGWEHYRAMIEVQLDRHLFGDALAVIDDWTDDFDTPENYEQWVARRDDPTPPVPRWAGGPT